MVAYFLFLKTTRQATLEAEKDAIFVKKIHTSVHGFTQKYKVIDGEVKRKFTV